MNEPLRPMNLGAILDRAIQIFRQQPTLFFGLAAIPGLVQMGTSLATVQPGASSSVRAGAALAVFPLQIVHLIVQAMTSGALCLAASAVNLGGTTSVRNSFKAFSSRKASVVGLTLLQGIFAFWPLVIVAIISAAVGAGMGAGPAAIYVQLCIWTVGGIPCLFLYARYALAFPATAIEGLPASPSLDRSVALSAGGRMKIFLGILVPAIPGLILTFGSIGLIAHFKASSPLLAGSPYAVLLIEATAGFISTLVFSPYGSIVLTLLYYDQRIRREGYDVERMMVAAGLDPNAADIAAGLPQPAVPALAHGVLPALAESREGNQQA